MKITSYFTAIGDLIYQLVKIKNNRITLASRCRPRLVYFARINKHSTPYWHKSKRPYILISKIDVYDMRWPVTSMRGWHPPPKYKSLSELHRSNASRQIIQTVGHAHLEYFCCTPRESKINYTNKFVLHDFTLWLSRIYVRNTKIISS